MAKFKFRTPFDLGDFNDDSVNNEPSLTDPSQDEPIERLVQRLMRGEPVSTLSGSYDVEIGPEGPSAAFNALPIQHRADFDIADAAPVIERAASLVKELEKPADQPAPAVAPAPVPAAPPPDLQEGKPN